ncbi:hypothetical protein HDU86_006044 [Geranomyces michiganensis]|nr:hypothetical protein HDU86_006044 [Geranomyces michiganensis]
MSQTLSPEHAQQFYDLSLNAVARMRCALLPACQKDGTLTRALSVVLPPGTTSEGKRALKAFDTWAQETLNIVWIGILEKEEKKSPSIQSAIEQKIPDIDPDVAARGLQQLSAVSRASLLRTFLLLVLTSNKRYDARTRVLLRKLAKSLALPFPADYEESVDETLKHPSEVLKESQEAVAKREEKGRTMRNFKIGLAGVVGATALAVTGGLAAPLVGAGFATLFGAFGLGSTAAGMLITGLGSSGLVVGSLFGAYGGHKTSQMISNRTKEVSDFDFVPLPKRVNNRLHYTLCVSGWLGKREDVHEPWTVISGIGDVNALQWEVESLLALGNALTTMMKSYALGYLKAEIIKQTVLATLMAGLWPLSILKFGKLVDNPWSNSMDLARRTGIVLADLLVEKVKGERPVTLIGYSLGARVIFYCLEELARRDAYGIVENAYMFGLPGPGTDDLWKGIRRTVAGRVVNGYSAKDWLLAFLYRTTNVKLAVPGLQPVNVVGIEDIDVSDVVDGHLKYRGAIGKCLSAIGAEDLDGAELDAQIKVLQAIEREESTDKLPVEEFVTKECEKNPPLPERPPAQEPDVPPAQESDISQRAVNPNLPPRPPAAAAGETPTGGM